MTMTKRDAKLHAARGMRVSITGLITATALLIGACTSGTSHSPGITGGGSAGPAGSGSGTAEPTVVLEDIERVASLRTFDQCSSLLEYLRAETVARVGPYGLDDGPRFGIEPFPMPMVEMATDDSASGDMAMSEPAMAMPDVAESSAPSAGADGGGFSDTNVQVVGVDEPDIVKTDGNRILAVAQGHLHYVDLTTGDPQYRGRVNLASDWGHEIFMRGDRALVFSTSYSHDLRPVAEDEVLGGAAVGDILPPGTSSALIQEVDLSNPSAMRVVSELRVEGHHLSARAVGSTVWVSLSSYPVQFQFVYPSGPDAEDAAEATNKALAASAGLGAWLPSYRFDGPNGTSAGLLPDCDQLYSPAEFSGFTVLSVLTFDMDEPLDAGDAASVLADGHTLYGSGQSLYMAGSTPIMAEPADDGRDVAEDMIFPQPTEWETTVHKFSVSSDGPARYEASGTVPGSLLNQFAMDEHNGYFRIATTLGEPWNSENSSSQVAVLQQEGRLLTEVGNVGNLGLGERIYSVRFVGDTGYVVTFRQVDPLYVLDLSDPTAPSVAGELKIPGFSTYLHPLGDGLLVGVGQDADDTGRTRGAKVSLFDVSNPAAPAELDVIVFPDGYSDVEWNHKAFLYWAPEEMVVIPLSQYRNQDFVGAVALRVNRNGISELGRLSHQKETSLLPGCRPVNNPEIQRNFGASNNDLRICPLETSDNGFNHECEHMKPEWAREEWPSLDISDNEVLLICWVWTPPIQRLLVADEVLWSMSDQALQANRLDSFAYVKHFDLRP